MESIPTQANQPLAARQPLARFGIGTAGVLLANVGFLSFFLVYDLSLYQLVLIYWCECFWVGVFSFLKLLVASLIGDPFANRHVHVSRGSSLFFSVIAAWFTSGLFFFLFALLGFLVFSPAFDSADAHGVQLEHLLPTSWCSANSNKPDLLNYSHCRSNAALQCWAPLSSHLP